MRAILLLAALAGVGFFAWQQYFVPPEGLTVTRESDASRPFVVKVHADSCQKCISLGPVWTRLDAELGDSARLVVLDVTNEERFAETVRVARYLGLSDFLEQRMEQTGLIAVLHGESREPVELLDGTRQIQPYLAAVEKARRS